MEVKDYKKYHEDHMQNNPGTSFLECAILVLMMPLCAFLSSFVYSCSPKVSTYVFEFGIIVMPIILNCTILSNINHLVFLVFLLFVISIIFVKADIKVLRKFLNSKVQNNKSSITNYRAITNLVSVLCILAVDFTVFPKRLAKTESFGFGFMDLGVGFFIFSNGIVRKFPVPKNQFLKLIKSISVLFLLGLIRVVSVKSIDYHEHVSEYGVHWNFFFTLAFCHLIAYCITLCTKNMSPHWLALSIAVVHQLLLSFGLQQWVLSDIPRDSFLSANREGLVSSLGFVSLYFAASAVGNFLFKPEKQTYKMLFGNLILLSTFVWLVATICFFVFHVSRRLINISYIFWILGLSCTSLVLFVGEELILLSSVKEKDCFKIVPNIFEHINANGLFFFLFGNLLTGLINTVCQTLLLGKFLSLMIIICYMAVLSSATFFLYERKIFLKL